MRRIGVMGGTFDPIHIAHLICAETVCDALQLDSVMFMPTGDPHFKQGSVVACAEERLYMTRLACRDNPKFAVSDLEVRREGITYTVDTLEELHLRHPENEYYFILGADAFSEITSWYGANRLSCLATYVVVPRSGYDMDALVREAEGFRIRICDVPAINLSSTMVRNRIAEGHSVRYLVPEQVRLYIEKTGLYGFREKEN